MRARFAKNGNEGRIESTAEVRGSSSWEPCWACEAWKLGGPGSRRGTLHASIRESDEPPERGGFGKIPGLCRLQRPLAHCGWQTPLLFWMEGHQPAAAKTPTCPASLSVMHGEMAQGRTGSPGSFRDRPPHPQQIQRPAFPACVARFLRSKCVLLSRHITSICTSYGYLDFRFPRPSFAGLARSCELAMRLIGCGCFP